MTLSDIAIALAVLLLVVGAAVALLAAPQRSVIAQTHTAEINQRIRAGFSRLQRDIGNAVVSSRDPRTGALRLRAAVIPTRTGRQLPVAPSSEGVFDPAALTVVTVADERRGVTGSALSALSPWVVIRPDGACGVRASDGDLGGDTCGFSRDALVLIGDETGRTDLFQIAELNDERLFLRSPPSSSSSRHSDMPTYEAGSSVAHTEVRSYRFDEARAQLRYRRDWGAEVPLLDNVVGVQFRYFGVTGWPQLTGVEATADGRCELRPAQVESGSRVGTVEITRDALSDGPWCGGHSSFDADLLKLRRVRVEVRFDASAAELRGARPELFLRPGSARDPRRWVRDRTARIDLALRIPWRP